MRGQFVQGPGLSNYSLGQVGGVGTETLSTAEMPTHNHTVNVASVATTGGPGGAIPAPTAGHNIYGPNGASTMAADTLGAVGGNQPHENMQPYLVIDYCIALVGIFPQRS